MAFHAEWYHPIVELFPYLRQFFPSDTIWLPSYTLIVELSVSQLTVLLYCARQFQQQNTPPDGIVLEMISQPILRYSGIE